MGSGLRRLTLATLLAGAVALTGVAGRSAPTTRADTLALRVGYFPNITHAQAVLGFGLGTFAKKLSGINVTGQVFNAGPDEMNAIFAGAIDMGYIGPGPAINGFVKSQGGVVIVAGAATGGAELVASKKSGITTVADLSGKKVAVPQLGNTQDIELRQLLRDHGLKPTDHGGTVQVLAVQNSDTLTLFKRGDLDAALVPEPWGLRLVKQRGAHIVLDWNQLYGGTLPATVIVVSSSFLKAHRDVVVRFLRVHAQLTADLHDTAAVYAPLYAQIKKLSGKGIPSGILEQSLQRTFFSTSINQGLLQKFADFSKNAGYLKQSASISGLVNPWPLAHLNDSSIQ